ncbi:MAG: DNA (cytosine-5-)-methyltransferase [Syntrophus sp. (in: bacteria)]|nr:DNA (cytosine-5-)-methyltransferase [Syntrophus sp. (in: bacteria)]
MTCQYNRQQRDVVRSDVPQHQSPQPFTCIDLFAGAGGLSLAAMNIGLKVKVAIEKNKHACNTYRHNLIITDREPYLYNADILKVSPVVIADTHFSGNSCCDIVLGGPPCQGFSVHRLNDAGVDDPRNELILRYFEFVDALKPKAFLMENVPGILWKRHQDYLSKFYEKGKNTGYFIHQPVVLDARDFGVPQRRKRVFILGVRNEVSFNTLWPPTPTHGSKKFRKKNPKLKPWRIAEEVFASPPSCSDENNYHMNHTREMLEVFESTPLNGGSRFQSIRVLPCHKNHNGHKDVYGRIDSSRPGPTMTTACINPSKGRFVHPTEHHGITIRHAARFQTFPEWFTFKGGLIAAGEQIGNAVPIKLGEILLQTILEGLRK